MGSLTRQLHIIDLDKIINQAVMSHIHEITVGNRATAKRVYARMVKRANARKNRLNIDLDHFKVVYKEKETGETVTYDPKKKVGVTEKRQSRLR